MMSEPLAMLARSAMSLLVFTLMTACVAAPGTNPSAMILRPSDVQGDGTAALSPVIDDCGVPSWMALTMSTEPGAAFTWQIMSMLEGDYDLYLEYQMGTALNSLNRVRGPLEFQVTVGGVVLPVIAYRTGDQFVIMKLGRVKLARGAKTLTINDIKCFGGMTARLGSIYLYPASQSPASYRSIAQGIHDNRKWVAPEHIALPKLISDHMVLQRDVRAPIWGRAKPGAQVTVEIAGQRASARVDKRGCWKVLLNPLSAGGPYAMTITCGEEAKTLTDVLVGEVWLGAGQSNMTWALAINPELGPNYQTDQATQDFVGKGDFPLIRVSSDAHHLVTPNGGSWVPMPQVTTRFLPALMSCAAILLHRSHNVPVGIIVRSFGGTTGVSWVDRDSFENDPNIQQGLATYTEAPSSEKEAAYRQAFDEWKPRADEARKNKQPVPPPPAVPLTGAEMWTQGSELYAHYITLVLPYAVRGIVWDQGESGTGLHKVSQADMLYAIAHGWRAAIGNDRLPFIYIRKDQYRPLTDITARLGTLPNTWMVDNEGLRKDLHPPDKLEYAKRLVQVMTEKVYGGQ